MSEVVSLPSSSIPITSFALADMGDDKPVTRSQKEKEAKAGPGLSGELGEQIAMIMHTKLEEFERRTQKMCEAQLQHIEERFQCLTDMVLSPPKQPTNLSDDQPQQLSAPSDIQSQQPSASGDRNRHEAQTQAHDCAARAGDRRVPQCFDGSVSWTAYYAQFQAIARQNQWSDSERAMQLAASLKGPALDILGHLPEEQFQDFGKLSAALKQRFGDEHQEETFRVRFRTRYREPKEPLPELAHAVEKLGHLAYPSAPADFREVLIRDQFIDALDNTETKIAVKQSRPASLREALACALEVESLRASLGRREFIADGTSGFKTRTADTDKPLTTDQSLSSVLQGILGTLERLEANQSARTIRSLRPSSPSHSIAQRRLTGTCWNCGKIGHMRRDCRAPRLQEAPSRQSGVRMTERQSEN